MKQALREMELSVPVVVAEFHKYVRSYGGDRTGTPETALYCPAFDKTAKKSRRATMTFTPDGLVCVQEFGTIIVPLANVAFVRLAE